MMVNRKVLRGVFAAITATLVCNFALAAGPDRDRYIVSFLDEAKGRSALNAAGAQVLLDLPSQEAVAARIPAKAIRGLQRNPNIEYIEVDAVRFPMAETTPWGIVAVQADQVSDANTGETLVCIIDSGYSNAHEDLPDLGAGDGTYDPGTGNPLAESTLCHHGTHVAGTIAALDNEVGVVGVNPGDNVGLHIVKVFEDDASSPSGCGWGYSSGLVAALDACMEAAATAPNAPRLVVNMSLGGPVKNRTEQRAFTRAYNDGVLSVAAAGNDGNTRHSYPASYDSVISVAAVDSALNVADFSQQTNQVELAAPGVAVRSTVTMETGSDESLSVDGTGFEAVAMEGTVNGTVTGSLFVCSGVGSPGDCAGASGSVCLISRGDISFADKALECQAQGGVGAAIYNNGPALFSGTLGGIAVSIPVVGVSGDDAATLLGLSGQSAEISTESGNYAYYDGTSMATPHVAGVAALVWSQGLGCSNGDIRNALTTTALDLGPTGRDNAYGYGMVQAADAMSALDCTSGGGGGDGGTCELLSKGASCSDDSQCCSGSCKGKPGSQSCK